MQRRDHALFTVLLLAVLGGHCAMSPAESVEERYANGCVIRWDTGERWLSDDICVISTEPTYGYIDRHGKPIPLPGKPFIHLCRHQEGLAAFRVYVSQTESWGPQRWGFLDKQGRIAIPATFQYADDFCEGLAAVNVGGRPNPVVDPSRFIPMVDNWGRHFVYPMLSGKWGFVNRKGVFVVKPIYDDVSPFSEGLAQVRGNGLTGFIDKSGRLAFKLSKGSCGDFSEGCAVFYDGNKGGYLDRTGKIVIPARYYTAGGFSCGRAAVRISATDKLGYIDKSGNLVIEPQFDRGARFSEGFASVLVGDKYGFIDTQGRMVVPATYDMAYDFREGMAPVRKGDKWGYIDTSGKASIPPRFVGAGYFRGGIARVATAGTVMYETKDCVDSATWRFIDRAGNFVMAEAFDQALDFWEDRAVVATFPKCGLQDAQGKVIVAPRFDFIGPIGEGLVEVSQNGRRGFMDPAIGRIIIPLRFENANRFSCGRAGVRENGKWGVIDKTGGMVVKPRFEKVEVFSEGVAAVQVKSPGDRYSLGKWGFIDTAGTVIIEPEYRSARDFSEGLAAVGVRGKGDDTYGKEGYVDKSGTMVIEDKFDIAGDFHEGLARVLVRGGEVSSAQQEEKVNAGLDEGIWGFIDKTGKYVIKPRFVHATDFSGGRATVFDGQQEYEVDADGRLYEIKKQEGP